MEIWTFESSVAASEAVAERLQRAIHETPDLVLGLATGRTPVDVYAALRRMNAAGRLDFRRVTTFNLDEFSGIPSDHPGSFRTFMDAHLFSHVNLNPANIHFLDGMAPDGEAECARYERAIADAGGIDVQVLGIGGNGHIGFNEPGEELVARTHRVVLHDVTRRANAPLFGGRAEDVPREALSMGMATILNARTLLLMATGSRKARCIERAVRGPLTTRLPASFLQLHARVELLLDRDAASLLNASA